MLIINKFIKSIKTKFVLDSNETKFINHNNELWFKNRKIK